MSAALGRNALRLSAALLAAVDKGGIPGLETR